MKYYLLAFVFFALLGAGLFYCINEFINSSAEIQPVEAAIFEETQKSEEILFPPIEIDSTQKQHIDSTNYEVIDGYTAINWRTLAYVEFVESYVDSLDAYIPFPDFKAPIKRFDNQKVQIKGYTIPIEETGDESILVLSANPFAACFFCGNAGPETVMDIKLKQKLKKRLKQDDKTTFRGRLRLNATDLYYLNYILEDAELVD